MAFAVDDIIIRVRVEGQGALDDLRRAQDDVRDGARDAGAGVDGLSTGLVNAAAAMQLAAVAAGALSTAIGAIRAPIGLAASFEREFALVATLSDKVGKDLEQGLLELASRVPQSAGDITKATYQAISAGIDPGQVLDFLDAASKAAVAGNTTITASVESLTTAVNAFASQGVTAAQASDVLFATVKAGVTTFDELNASLGQASAVATYGVSIEEVGAAVASLTKVGFSTSDAITRINAAVKAIAGPTGQAAKEFKRLGIEIGIERLQAVGLSGVLADIQEKTGGAASEVAKLTRRFEGQQGLLGLLGGNYAGFVDNLDKTTSAAGNTEAAFAKLSDTTLGVIDNFKSTVEVTLTRLGQELLPTVTDAVLDLGEIVTREGPATVAAITDITKGLAALIPVALEAAAAVLNVFTNARVNSARAEAFKARETFIGSSAEGFALGGADPLQVAAAAGDDRDAQRRALEDFAAERAAVIADRRADFQDRFERAQRSLERERAVAADLGSGLGPSIFEPEEQARLDLARKLIPDLEQRAETARNALEAATLAGNVLDKAINDAIDQVEAGALGAESPLTPTPPRDAPAIAARRGGGKRGGAPVDLGPGRFDALAGGLTRGVSAGLGAAGEGFAFVAAAASEREEQAKRNEQLLSLGQDLAERRLALVEDESTRRLAQLTLRHQQELEAIGEFEEQRTELLAVQAAERERLERDTAKAIRESVARDSAATLGSLADLTEAFGAAGTVVSVVRAAALAADAIYFGIKGAGYQAEAIGAFASLNVPQGLALQAAAIKHFAQSALAAKGAVQLGASVASGGSGGGGGGALGASRAQTDGRRDGRIATNREPQAPNLTIVLSDAVAISDRPEIIRPMVASFAQELQRQMHTRGGVRLPAAG